MLKRPMDVILSGREAIPGIFIIHNLIKRQTTASLPERNKMCIRKIQNTPSDSAGFLNLIKPNYKSH